MPWKDSGAVDERARFCLQATEGDLTMAELCRAFGVSRRTGYKWLERFESGGVAALADRSRARHTQAYEYSKRIRNMVINARLKHPTWGAKKILPWLQKRHPQTQFPSLTTMEKMFRTEGLVRPPRQSRRFEGATAVQPGPARPNGLWTVDFKGELRLGNSSLCYPLTVLDNHSRYLLGCVGMVGPQYEPTRAAFHRLFIKYGLPDRIRSDNGSPFTSCGHGQLSRLSVYWMTLGIDVERTRRGSPQDNARHERMHRTLKAETARPPARTRQGQQRRFNAFCRTYNEERPHEALEMMCPCELYESSSRPYKVVEYEYPGYWEVRKVTRMGQVSWKGQLYFLSEALIGQQVGLVEIEDRVWKICFRALPIATLFDGKKGVRIKKLKVKNRGLRRYG